MNLLLSITPAMLLLLQGCQLKDRRSTPERPNIIFILADDLGWADLSCYGNRFNESPNLDRLAAEGLMFTDAYAACPVCSPTRASILSGQYPTRVGVFDFIPGYFWPYQKLLVPKNRTQYLPPEIHTIGEALQEAGYRTGYFGKWHLGSGAEHLPSAQGFDTSIVYRYGGFYDFNTIPDVEIDPDLLLADYLTDCSIGFIRKNDPAKTGRPFFLFLAHFDVHVQLDSDSLLIRKYLAKEKAEGYPCNAVYAAMIESIDRGLGRIMSELEQTGIDEQTMIVFFSDNGGLAKRYDKAPLIDESKRYIYQDDTLLYVASSNAPLRNEKGSLFEGGIREPMIVRWPEVVRPGRISSEIVCSMDLYPTFVAAAGGKMSAEQVSDGLDLLPLFHEKSLELAPAADDEPVPGRVLFWHYPFYHHSVPASAVRKGKWKLIHFLEDGHRELYNLETDIGETEDLSAEHPEIVRYLSVLLDEWRTETRAKMPTPNPDHDPSKSDISRRFN